MGAFIPFANERLDARSARAALSAKSAMRNRCRLRMPNHCSLWFIQEQCTREWYQIKCGCRESHSCTCLPVCIRTLSKTTRITRTLAHICLSNPTCYLVSAWLTLWYSYGKSQNLSREVHRATKDYHNFLAYAKIFCQNSVKKTMLKLNFDCGNYDSRPC